MIDHEPYDEAAAIWPPAISLPLSVQPKAVLGKTARLGKASLWTAGVGIACWLGIVAVLTLLVNLHQAVYNQDAWVHTAYFLGLACEVTGIGLGILGRSIKVGKVGLVLSACVLCLMVLFTLAAHQASESGGWIWNANEGDNGDCGCDNSG